MEDNIKIVNEDIKELETSRYQIIKKFVELADVDKINYDLHGDTTILELEKYLKQINDLGSQLHSLYRVKDKLEEMKGGF